MAHRPSSNSEERKSPSSKTNSSLWNSTVSVGSAALAAYGAYHLASLAVEAWNEGANESQDSPHQQHPTKTCDVEETLTNEEIDDGRAPSGAGSGTKPCVGSLRPSPSHRPNNTLHMMGSPGDTNTDISQTSSFTRETGNSSAGFSPRTSESATSPSIGKKLSSALWQIVSSNQHQSENSPQSPNPQPRQRNVRTMRERRRLISKARTQVREALYRLHPTTLKRSILDATNFQAERQALQKMRQAKQQQKEQDQSETEGRDSSGHDATATSSDDKDQELALWNTIAVQTLTRFLVAQYATCILFVVLTVQVTVLLGYQNSDNDTHVSVGGFEADSRWVLEQTYQYFFQHGLPSLIQTVRRIVSNELQSRPGTWTVTEPCPLGQLETLFRKVQATLHPPLQEEGTKNTPRSMLRFAQSPSVLMDDFECDQDASDHRLDLMDETWDFLESPLVRDALVDALETQRNQLTQDLCIGDLPLAQVLTNMKKACSQYFDSFTTDEAEDADEAARFVDAARQNPHLTALEHLPAILELLDACSS